MSDEKVIGKIMPTVTGFMCGRGGCQAFGGEAHVEIRTRVVNVRTDEFDVYIGRGVPRAKDPRCRVRSVYANPSKIGPGTTREDALIDYEDLWRGRLVGKQRRLWRERLLALDGKRLGCWCAPKPCHGGVLVKLIEEVKR